MELDRDYVSTAILNWIEVWALTWPLDGIHIFPLIIALFGFVFGVIVLLEV